jgi:hypothetical protein
MQFEEAQILEIGSPAKWDYSFIIWDRFNQSSITLFDKGMWTDWDEFVAQSRKFIGQSQNSYLYEHLDEFTDEEPDFDEDELEEWREVRISILLKNINGEKPHFVKSAEAAMKEREKKRKKSRVQIAIGWFYERVIAPLLLLTILGGLFWGIFGDVTSRLMGSLGLIEYQSKSEGRYQNFLISVSNCSLVNSVKSSERTENWPVYATYECPDGSKKIWKKKVKVITEVGEKIIIE